MDLAISVVQLQLLHIKINKFCSTWFVVPLFDWTFFIIFKMSMHQIFKRRTQHYNKSFFFFLQRTGNKCSLRHDNPSRIHASLSHSPILSLYIWSITPDISEQKYQLSLLWSIVCEHQIGMKENTTKNALLCRFESKFKRFEA